MNKKEQQKTSQEDRYTDVYSGHLKNSVMDSVLGNEEHTRYFMIMEMNGYLRCNFGNLGLPKSIGWSQITVERHIRKFLEDESNQTIQQPIGSVIFAWFKEVTEKEVEYWDDLSARYDQYLDDLGPDARFKKSEMKKLFDFRSTFTMFSWTKSTIANWENQPVK